MYGDAPNRLRSRSWRRRWDYADPEYADGIPETFPIDQSLHSLFGASKVAADVMVQEYGRYFGMPTCCLRGGCLTGPNHTGVELHGFLSYLVKCNLEEREYQDLRLQGQTGPRQYPLPRRRALHPRVRESPRCGEVYNLGGGKANSCSILEAFVLVERFTGKRATIHLRRREPHRRPHLLLQRSAEDAAPLSGLGHNDQSRADDRARSSRLAAEACVVKILVTGACGFVGSTLIREWL